jgi:F0F1-type ATP synthase assembly protein I
MARAHYSATVSVGSWMMVGFFSSGCAFLAGMWFVVLVRAPADSSNNARIFIAARIAELLVSILVIVLAALTHSLWTLVALIVLFVAMSVLRRTLRRRELAG